jgi:hypothetical protein
MHSAFRRFRLVYTPLLVMAAALLVGCPPAQYVRVTNATDSTLKIDFTCQGSGTFLPHFTLKPGESRRVNPGCEASAHDLWGRSIGTLDLRTLKEHSSYFDPSTYTFNLVVTSSGIIPTAPR